jgi:hypothetical protein
LIARILFSGDISRRVKFNSKHEKNIRREEMRTTKQLHHISYIYAKIEALLVMPDRFSHNESKYIIREALFYLLPQHNLNVDINCNKQELLAIAHKIRILLLQ